MTVVLSVVCVALVAVVAALVAVVRRLQADLAASDARAAQLEADLDAALRPRPPTSTTERYLRRVVRTASKVRTEGLTGLLQSTIDDLQSWAGSERADILNMAAADGTVTLFFSDIEGSTSLNHQVGDKAWVRVLAAHDAILRARIGQYRGQVVKTAGDGFMVAFRDAEAACRAALAVQQDLRRPTDLTLRKHGIRVRIGVNTGQVVAKEGDYFGRNVAIAARVADLAAGGQVLAGDAVREALEDDAAVELRDPEVVELKGLPGEHTVWRVAPAGG
ncbi:class 3 adenylate cyclase [Nocardioides thalensis]|uniref:Class 3 adenylate cyclase n=1 Tax=Nocardioides thalensis TaxID=1914755 RepID=A0A853BYE6_9ACTN|nr:class 3 adenylate cyclase [Nocardioides thalensis]